MKRDGGKLVTVGEDWPSSDAMSGIERASQPLLYEAGREALP